MTEDTTYGTVDNIVALEHEHIRAFVPLPDFDQRTPFYGEREFHYNPEQDTYTCPNGATVRFKTHVHAERVKRYHADAATCNACPLKPNCTTSMHGRILIRSFDESSLDRVRAYHVTHAYHKAMRKRQVWVEPLFARSAKTGMACAVSACGGTGRVNCEALMRATGQNLKRLLKKRDWERRPDPAEAVFALFFGTVLLVGFSYTGVCVYLPEYLFTFTSKKPPAYSLFLMSFVSGFFNSL